MKNQSFEENGIKHVITVGPVTIDKGPYVSDFQKKETVSFQFRQVINERTTYPSARVRNEMQANFFSDNEFGFTEGESYNSVQNRVAFMDVPVGTTMEQMVARLAIKPDACIYKVLSHRPILTSGQMSAIAINLNGLTIDKLANTQAIRYPENDTTTANGTAGKLILDASGKIQYRATFIWDTEKADIDERGKVEYYLSPELSEELSGKVISASLVAEQGI